MLVLSITYNLDSDMKLIAPKMNYLREVEDNDRKGEVI